MGLVVLGLVSLVVFLPLLRYALENPDLFSYRSFTRLGTVEQPLPDPAGAIFLQNLWRAVTMFAWDDGEIWVHSVTHRPALDVISAAFFYLGVLLVSLRYLRQRNWLDIFLILSRAAADAAVDPLAGFPGGEPGPQPHGRGDHPGLPDRRPGAG